eukprot:2441820-Amphidinium_carterae.1
MQKPQKHSHHRSVCAKDSIPSCKDELAMSVRAWWFVIFGIAKALDVDLECPYSDDSFCKLWNEVVGRQFASSCRVQRLLVQDLPGGDVPDVGQLVAAAVHGLAEAYHSRRTLIVGPSVASALCPTGWDCVFQPLSSCSLSDVRPSEKHALLLRQTHEVWEGDRVVWAHPVRGEVALAVSPLRVGLLSQVLHCFAGRLQLRVKHQLDSFQDQIAVDKHMVVHSPLESAIPASLPEGALGLVLTSVAAPLFAAAQAA